MRAIRVRRAFEWSSLAGSAGKYSKQAAHFMAGRPKTGFDADPWTWVCAGRFRQTPNAKIREISKSFALSTGADASGFLTRFPVFL